MAITKDDIKSNISLDKTEVKIDLKKELKGLDSATKSKVSAEIADLLRREVGNDAVNGARSSVTGQKFKGLSKAYRAFKKSQTGSTKANLVLDGDMLGNLKKQSGVQSVKLKITRSKEIKKFFNHNTGDTLPKRQVLPNEGESFRSGIMKKINKVIRDARKSSKDSK